MMSNNTDVILIESAAPVRQPHKRFLRSLEYGIIANLAVKHYEQDGVPDFKQLLAIPLAERIPGLITTYGMKQMYKLVRLLLQEFCYNLPLPKSKKLTDTGISSCTCDLLLAAYEEQLSLEDLILFFERVREGKYGSFKGLITHNSIMLKLELYRQERFKVYTELKEKREAELKAHGPQERISSEPTAIRHLFEKMGADATLFPLKNIS